MVRMFRSEWLKLRKSVIWLLAVVSPLLAALVGILSILDDAEIIGGSPWLYALSMMAALHAMLFLPLLTGVYAALVCRYEHAGGGWKQLLSLPVSRSQVYLVKFAFIMLLLAITQLLFLAALLGIGLSLGFPGPIPWKEIIVACLGGWIACLPLAALQLAVSTAWSSFAAPLAVNVIFTLPNMLVANSAEYAPYYPWVQPMLAMMPRDEMSFGAFNVSPVTLFAVIGGSFLLFLASGWTYFSKKAV
ncbi:ABC transporter permease [Paenibacillus mendelii]|uniref:ABC transporter permease n=1 Tax=Paenibacillus mendelii TaxID=206163 RepID=A0ABV6J4K5_9BACL|nr:ABC transporter permease [Paenibacillus mendelii]MCQ6561951.1 ABC transporter permease [Paenibacillus mendelii]